MLYYDNVKQQHTETCFDFVRLRLSAMLGETIGCKRKRIRLPLRKGVKFGAVRLAAASRFYIFVRAFLFFVPFPARFIQLMLYAYGEQEKTKGEH